jgi:hypothetical protein
MDDVGRLRQLNNEESIDSGHSPAPDCSPSFLGITVAVDTYPILPNDFYGFNPTEADGEPEEGIAGTFSDDVTTVIYAFGIGTAVPPEGTRAIVRRAGGRWVFQYNG